VSGVSGVKSVWSYECLELRVTEETGEEGRDLKATANNPSKGKHQ